MTVGKKAYHEKFNGFLFADDHTGNVFHDIFTDGKIQNVTLLYGSKTKEDIICKEWLDGIKKDWFKKVYILNDNHSFFDSEIHKYETGHIDKEIIKKHVESMDNSVFYICGPEFMKNSLKNILNEIGVNKQNIVLESFFW